MNGTSAPEMTTTRQHPALIDRVYDACNAPAAREAGWRVEESADPRSLWTYVNIDSVSLPVQGWKLHISANAASADTVLERALPVLLAHDAPFKVVPSQIKLIELNDGNAGTSQIGKFMTVYPVDEEQAVRLAAKLDEATRGLPGPAVPSDKPLAPGSLVHYRYGGFEGRYIQKPHGAIVPAIRTPDGSLEPDERGTSYQKPEWVDDPFAAAGIVIEQPENSPLVANRYLVVSTIHTSPRGAVHLAVDIEDANKCVLKRARPSNRTDWEGRDDGERLRHEAAVLELLRGNPHIPELFDLVEHDGHIFMAIEDVEGVTLEQHVMELSRGNQFIPGEQVARWGRELAGILESIHARGYIYRDLKSPNIIVAPDGKLRLIDFDIAHRIGDPSPPHGRGTRGYMSPQQFEKTHVPAITDDVYGVGAILYFVATSCEPSMAPDPVALLDRPVTIINPAISSELEAVIVRCLDPDPRRRYASMDELQPALAAIEGRESVIAPEFGEEDIPEPDTDARRRYREMARRLGNTIAASAESFPDGSGVAWRSIHVTSSGIYQRDVNSGSAGTLLALAEIVAEFGDDSHRKILAEGARWLVDAPRPEGEPLTGLYVGESGVGAALLRAGQVLGDGNLISAAAKRGRWIATQPHKSPDLFNGTAGRLRFHLFLWDETGDDAHLQAAIEAGETLLQKAEVTELGAMRWRTPDGYEGMSGQVGLGYAHGTAGIGDVLLDLFEGTGDERFLAGARGAAQWLAGQAVPVLEDGSGLNWPSVEGVEPTSAFWCHGAAGIGRFFLHLAALDLFPGAGDIARRAGRTIARGIRQAGATQCHGLAGNLEFLLDIYQTTGERAYYTEARQLARLLDGFAAERDGHLVWPSETPRNYTPDYLVGYAGVALSLLRLGDPEHVPHQMSRRGFRRRNRSRAID